MAGPIESLANKGEFTEQQFRARSDSGYTRPSHLRDSRSLRSAAASCHGQRCRRAIEDACGPRSSAPSPSTQNCTSRNGSSWQVEWPLVKGARRSSAGHSGQLPPLGCDLTATSDDDWGAQDVESPHVRIVDMHPVQRADGLVLIMGELLNEDVVPAFVSVTATLSSKDRKPIDDRRQFRQDLAPSCCPSRSRRS